MTKHHQSGNATLHEVMQEQFDSLHTPMPSDPRDAIRRLIQLETAIALDPDVSEQAAVLVQRGIDKGLEMAQEAIKSKKAHTDDPDNSVWSAAYEHVASEHMNAIEQLKGKQ